jgi:hypothetical protein
MPNAHTVRLGEILFSRCLEAGHWPDKIQFTKYLYLLDYCHWRYHERQLTDIGWIFYHYGPWSPDAAAVMDSVQDCFRLGWRDLTEGDEEEREFHGFDPIAEKLGAGIEGMIKKIIGVFKDRDVTELIDWCYTQTEPMLAARRGDALDFSTVPVAHEMPVFYPQAIARTMPQLNEASQARVAAYRAKASKLKDKARQWRDAMETTAYSEAMQMLAEQRQSDLPALHGRKVKLDDESVAALNELGHE